MKAKNIIIAIFLFVNCQLSIDNCFAQDIHFSQSVMTPLMLNPAFTGVFEGEHRAFLNYKNQWAGMAVKGAAYNTYAFSYDTRLLTKKISRGYLGAGINAFKDIAGDLKLGTTQINLSVSGVVYINKQQTVSGGMQLGYVQKSISTEDMQWDSQYDGAAGAFNPALPSNDVLTIPPYSFGDFSVGLGWSYDALNAPMYAHTQKKFNFGLAAFHLNKPSQKLNPYSTNITDNLKSKFVIHGDGVISIFATKYQLVPCLDVFSQGKSLEITGGALVRWIIKAESRYTGYIQGMALSLGAKYRSNDAIIPVLLYEYSDFAIGLSYDVNTSKLVQGTHGNGGVEISLRYIKPLGVSSTRVLD